MSYLPTMPDATLVNAFQAHPELAEPIHRFAETLMRGECALWPADRELMAAYVSAQNGCDYCRDSHARTLAYLDETAPDVAEMIADPEWGAVRPALRPVLAYADKLNRTPAEVDQRDVDAILEAGWDEATVTYAAVVTGFFNLMNRWVEGLGIGSDPDTVDAAGRMLASRGYAAVSELLGR